jgi:hypothetical protein
LVVITHGKASGDPRWQARGRYLLPSRAPGKRGFLVVVPARTGFSTGRRDEAMRFPGQSTEIRRSRITRPQRATCWSMKA